jgi:hypothetical protein
MVIRRIAPLPAAKVAALVYMVISFPFAILFWFFAPANSPFGGLGATGGALMVVILPIIYGVVGFIMTIIGAWLYNVMAGFVGGIRIEVQRDTSPET